MIALSAHPNLISEIIISKGVSKVGVYSTRLYYNGIPIEVVIDDFFPCLPCTTSSSSKPKWFRPVFAYTKSNEIWGMIIEKAFAKLYGSYS